MRILRKFSYFVLFLPCVFILFDEFTNSSGIQSLLLFALSSREQLFFQHTNTNCTRTWSDTQTHACKPNPSHRHTQILRYGRRHLLFGVHKLLIAVNRKLRGKQAFLMLMKFSRAVSPFKPALCYQVGRHSNKGSFFTTIFPYRGEWCSGGERQVGWQEQFKVEGERIIRVELMFFFLKLFLVEQRVAFSGSV